MRRLPPRLLTLAALLVMLALAGCGGSGHASGPSSASGPDPASLTPADAAVYGEALVRPSGAAQRGIVAAARKVSRLADPFGALRKAIDKANAGDGEVATYAQDIEPWLGARIGVFVLLPASAHSEPDVGLVAAARDRTALRHEFDRMRSDGDLKPGGTYRGVVYGRDKHDGSPTAVVGDFLVAGTTLRALQAAVDTSKGTSLADSSRYRDALGALPADRIALLYADPQAIAPALHAMRGLDPNVERILSSLHLTDGPPVTLALTAHADRIALELVAGSNVIPHSDSSTGAVSLHDVPGDAWLALATPPLGPLIKQVLAQAGVHDRAAAGVRQATGLDLDADILDPLGGLVGFARGTGPLDVGGGIALRMRDADSAQKLLTRLQAIAGAASNGAAHALAGGGFELQVPRIPQPIVVQAHADKLAVGYGTASAKDLLDPHQRFDDSDAGKAAIATLGDGFTPSFVLIAPPLVELLRALDEIDVANFSPALPYLSAYRSLAVGTKRDGDRTTVRIVAALK
ncbi:MAG TPA: DUF3352 domain-containing protein [Conexibacter sp.]|nr:DUF3352 domain-containing protein [Conexibacter sp.]